MRPLPPPAEPAQTAALEKRISRFMALCIICGAKPQALKKSARLHVVGVGLEQFSASRTFRFFKHPMCLPTALEEIRGGTSPMRHLEESPLPENHHARQTLVKDVLSDLAGADWFLRPDVMRAISVLVGFWNSRKGRKLLPARRGCTRITFSETCLPPIMSESPQSFVEAERFLTQRT